MRIFIAGIIWVVFFLPVALIVTGLLAYQMAMDNFIKWIEGG